MSTIKPLRRVAIIGTGVIGASWSALFLAKGLEVVATDVAPNAEAALKRFIESGQELRCQGVGANPVSWIYGLVRLGAHPPDVPATATESPARSKPVVLELPHRAARLAFGC
jgi:hypothetical protein